MKIIKFDPKPVVEEDDDIKNRLFMNETDFSCPKCQAKSKANFKGMIFRVLEFYCKSCGSFFKITNPGFGNNKKPK